MKRKSFFCFSGVPNIENFEVQIFEFFFFPYILLATKRSINAHMGVSICWICLNFEFWEE